MHRVTDEGIEHLAPVNPSAPCDHAFAFLTYPSQRVTCAPASDWSRSGVETEIPNHNALSYKDPESDYSEETECEQFIHVEWWPGTTWQRFVCSDRDRWVDCLN